MTNLEKVPHKSSNGSRKSLAWDSTLWTDGPPYATFKTDLIHLYLIFLIFFIDSIALGAIMTRYDLLDAIGMIIINI